MRRIRLGAGALALAAAVLAPGPVGGHAFLERADPRVGDHVRAAPPRVSLWFSERLEPAYSRVEVHDAGGRRVDGHDAAVGPADAHRLHVAVPPLPPGTYTVRWRVLSVDAHLTQGDFTFHVAP